MARKKESLREAIAYILMAEESALNLGGSGLEDFVCLIGGSEEAIGFMYGVAQQRGLNDEMNERSKKEYVEDWIRRSNGVPADVNYEIERLFPGSTGRAEGDIEVA